MTMPDPEPRPVEPTGNPRVDALIDAMVCPSCRTIYNAAKAKCDDPWHYDNRPDVTPYGKPSTFETGPFATGGIVEGDMPGPDGGCTMPPKLGVDLRQAFDGTTWNLIGPTQADVDAAYERGVAEGRRQATEGWEREWAVRFPPPVGLQAGYTEAEARAANGRGDAIAVSCLVGPWEPAEQTRDGAR